MLGWIRGMEQMGIYREGEFPLERPAQLGMFGGYFYINLSHMRLMTLRLGGSAESADAAWVGSRADVPPYVPHPRDDDPEQSAKAAATVAGVFARSSWPEIDEALDQAWARRAARPDLAAMRDTELVKYARTSSQSWSKTGSGTSFRRCRPASARACWPAWRQRPGRPSSPWTSSPVLATWSPPLQRRHCGSSPGR